MMRLLNYFKQLAQLIHNIFEATASNALPEIFVGLNLQLHDTWNYCSPIWIIKKCWNPNAAIAFRLDMAGSFASLVTMAIMGLLVFTIAEVLDRRLF